MRPARKEELRCQHSTLRRNRLGIRMPPQQKRTPLPHVKRVGSPRAEQCIQRGKCELPTQMTGENFMREGKPYLLMWARRSMKGLSVKGGRLTMQKCRPLQSQNQVESTVILREARCVGAFPGVLAEAHFLASFRWANSRQAAGTDPLPPFRFMSQATRERL